MIIHVLICHLIAVHICHIHTQFVAAREDEERIQLQFLPTQVQRQRTIINRYETTHIHQSIRSFQGRRIPDLRRITVSIKLRHLITICVKDHRITIHHTTQTISPKGIIACAFDEVVRRSRNKTGSDVCRRVFYAQHLVLIPGDIQSCREVPVLRADDIGIQHKLDTLIPHLTIVDNALLGTKCGVEILTHQQIVTNTIIELQRTAQQIVKQTIVDTYIKCRGLLPAKFGVRQVIVRVVQILRIGRITRLRTIAGHEIGRRTLVYITIHTISQTQFQEVEPRNTFHPCLVSDIPSGTDRPQRMVLVLGVESEEVCLIPANTSCQIITILVVVAYVGIEGCIAMEGLTLRNSRAAAETLGTVIHQTLPTLIGQTQPVHTDRCQRLIIIAEHHLINQTRRTILTQLESHNRIHVMLGIQETLVEVQLITESIAT